MKALILSAIAISAIVLGSLAVNAFAVITQMSVYIDGNLRDRQPYNINLANLSWDWSTYSEQPGWHTITVTAVDSNGNIGFDSENVLVDQRLAN